MPRLHKRSAATLAMLLRHLDRAQVASNTGSWEWDVGSNGLIWSDQIFRIFGLEPGAIEPTYPAFLERVHVEDRDMVEAAVGRALAEKTDYAIDHRIVLPDGAVRVVHELGVVEFDAAGEPSRMIGALCDVTAQREAEAACRRSQEMLGSLFRISPEAIVVTDSDGRILFFSAGAEAVFGYAADEIVGCPVETLMPEQARTAHVQHVHDFASAPADSLRMHERAEISGRRKNGEEFPAEASLAKLSTQGGPFYAAVVRDLSAVRAAEQRLIEAREQAERANMAKSSFLANMSHEIRTPLNGVLGVASALARTELSPKQREMVQLIETSGRALQGLLGDILDLAKVDAGYVQIRKEPFDLSQMVQDTFALFHASAAGKGVMLRLNVDPTAEGLFEGDDLRIRQVLSNLLSNAVKFTEAGEIRLSVAHPTCGPEGCLIRFVVEDTGIGFEPEFAERLFGRFEQADGSVTRKFGGTGLGLAISKALVDLMGGAIQATSSPGHGSIFSFQVPLRRVKGDARPRQAPTESTPQASHRQLQVLLAEDHPVNRKTVEAILDTTPVILTSVENGREAVAAVQTRPFDLVLMDMQMPVMDGLSAIREIRRLEAEQGSRPTPICVLTANALSEHREAAISAGANDLLTKPISAAELIGYVMGRLDEPEEA